MTKIVGLTGNIGVGKDTLAKFLAEEVHGARILPVAAPVKKTVQVAFDLPPEWITDEYKNVVHPDFGITPRDMYRIVGTDMFVKTFGRDFWVRHVSNFLRRNPMVPLLIIPDIRNADGTDFEASWLHTQVNSRLIRVTGQQRRDPGKPGHQSDVPVCSRYVHMEIENYGDLELLRSLSRALALQLGF